MPDPSLVHDAYLKAGGKFTHSPAANIASPFWFRLGHFLGQFSNTPANLADVLTRHLFAQ